MEEEDIGFVWLDDELYNKGKFLVRGTIMNILKPLEMYGQKSYVEQAIEELWKVCEDWGIYVRGNIDKPLSIEYVRRIVHE